MEGVTAFTTIVSLLSAYTTGRTVDQAADLQEFTTWLNEHNHYELSKLIKDNYKTSVSIKALLSQTRSELNDQLDSLATATTLLASRLPNIGDLARSLEPTVEISNQAYNILKGMSQEKIEYFIFVDEMVGAEIRLISNNGKPLEIIEQQFIRDDLNTLVELGLLGLRYNDSGGEVYDFTRAASRLFVEDGD